jgi:hypothetical protein
MSIRGIKFHVRRNKNLLEITCFEEQESEYSKSLFGTKDAEEIIIKYLVDEGFTDSAKNIQVSFSSTDEEF